MYSNTTKPQLLQNEKANRYENCSNFIANMDESIENKTVYLDDSYPMYEEPTDKITIDLYDYQKIALHAMYKMENYNYTRYVSNFGILSMPVGTGKTYIILALINIMKFTNNQGFSDMTITTYKKTYRTTLVVVGIPVFKQWEKCIKDNTTLKCLFVSSVVSFRILLSMMDSGEINEYDMILIKCTKVATSIKLPHGYNFSKDLDPMDALDSDKTLIYKKSIHVMDILNKFKNYAWGRVVYDDFDSLKMNIGSNCLMSNYTWYVSSTNDAKGCRTKRSKENNPLTNPFHDIFRINFYDSYLKGIVDMPPIIVSVIKINRPDDALISFIRSVNIDNTSDISDMLNGDAVEEAAISLGIVSRSVADIFKNLIGNVFEKYRVAGDVLAFIDYSRETAEDRMKLPDKTYRYGVKDLESYKEIEYKYVGINSLLDDNEIKYKDIKKRYGMAVDRAKDNLMNSECPVCRCNLEGTAFIINKCCQAIFCYSCGIKAQSLLKSNVGTCANCRNRIHYKDIIYISGVEIEDITEEIYDDSALDDDLSGSSGSGLSANEKYKKIVDIVTGDIDEGDSSPYNISYPNVVVGDKKFDTEPEFRKVLIFANYNECIKLIGSALDKESILYINLQGSSNRIFDTVNLFNNAKGNVVLLIKGSEYCNGLNLQEATDIIFAHKMRNSSIESQIVGRAQRINRKSVLRIHYVVYSSEL